MKLTAATTLKGALLVIFFKYIPEGTTIAILIYTNILNGKYFFNDLLNLLFYAKL